MVGLNFPQSDRGSQRLARERVACPLCGARDYTPWARENGFDAVTCSGCGLIYVNPRPALDSIDEAVRTGVHSAEVANLNVIGKPVPARVTLYSRVLADMFSDVVHAGRPIQWLDVGAGFGEVVEAVALIAPKGSRVEGIEPMTAKVEHARARGLPIREGYLADVSGRYGFISLINIFSHIPDFRQFLVGLRKVLAPGGEILIETGNAGDIGDRGNFPGPLTLPDHLVFAGERHIRRFLEETGFELIRTDRRRIDGFGYCARNIVKRLLGRPVPISLPYSSPTRTVLFRARSLS